MHRKILVNVIKTKSGIPSRESPLLFNKVSNPLQLSKRFFEEEIDLTQIEEPLFSFPFYYKIYYNALFCLLLSPNWISFKENSVSMEQFLPQKILCILMNIVLCTVYFMGLRTAFVTKIQEHPEIVFSLFYYMIYAWYPFAMIYMNWFNGKRVRGIMDVPKRPANLKTCICGFGLLGVNILLSTLFFCKDIVDDPVLFWNKFGRKVLYTFYVPHNITRQEPGVLAAIPETYSPLIIFGIAYQFLIGNQGVFLEMCAFVSSISTYEIATSGVQFYKENKGISLQVLLQRYAVAKKTIRRINNVNGIILLLLYLSWISSLSYRLVYLLDERSLSGIFFQIYFFIVKSLTFVIPAEAYLKLSYMKNKICEKAMREYDSKTVKQCEAFFRHCPGDCGLNGQKFFTVTYSFLGASVSILLMYIIIMIQLKGMSKDTKNC